MASYCTRGTYVNSPVVENLVRDVDGSFTVVVADADDAVSFISAERKEDRRQRAVGETLTATEQHQQQQHLKMSDVHGVLENTCRLHGRSNTSVNKEENDGSVGPCLAHSAASYT